MARKARSQSTYTARAAEKRAVLLAERARGMRFAPTSTEALLWSALRGSRLGVQFRRQFVIGRYIVDFCAPAAKLVVEIDGGYHKCIASADARRDSALQQHGFRVLRAFGGACGEGPGGSDSGSADGSQGVNLKGSTSAICRASRHNDSGANPHPSVWSRDGSLYKTTSSPRNCIEHAGGILSGVTLMPKRTLGQSGESNILKCDEDNECC